MNHSIVIDEQTKPLHNEPYVGLRLRFFITFFISFVMMLWARDFPQLSILFVDVLFCLFCASVFEYKLRYLFLLHPLITWILGTFYEHYFLELGDGSSYFVAIRLTLPSYISGSNSDLATLSVPTLVKLLQLGVAPVVMIPDYLYGGNLSDGIYFLWQACFFVILVSICLLLAKQWKVLRDEYLFCIILFSVISPTFFEISSALTRHLVTFISVFLFYLSFIAITKNFNLVRLIWLLIAVFLVFISKIAYFIPLGGFCVYYVYSRRKDTKLSTSDYIIIAGLVIIAIMCYGFFAELTAQYSGGIANEGAATFGGMANIPIISIFPKYIFAILSPFPWQNYNDYINGIYGGNSFDFIMHMLSSLTGMYFFIRLILYWRRIIKLNEELRMLIIYGSILSFSIIYGATGFHYYLSIFFPFFAPLFVVPRYKLSWVVPISVILFIELMYSLLRSFV